MDHFAKMKDMKLNDRDGFDKFMKAAGVTVCHDIIKTKLQTDDDGLLDPFNEHTETLNGTIRNHADEKIHFNQEHDFKEYELYNSLEGEGLTLQKAPDYL